MVMPKMHIVKIFTVFINAKVDQLPILMQLHMYVVKLMMMISNIYVVCLLILRILHNYCNVITKIFMFNKIHLQNLLLFYCKQKQMKTERLLH